MIYKKKQKKKPKTTKKQSNRIWESPRSFNHTAKKKHHTHTHTHTHTHKVLLILHSAHLASAKDEQHELDVLGERLAVVPVAVLLA